MSFTQAVRASFSQFVTTSGRARRAEYWWFSVLYVIATTAVTAIVAATDTPVLGALLLPVVVPMLTVSIRRLHDTGKSGWWALIALVPLVGAIAYLLLMAVDSTPGANRYGPPVKDVAPVPVNA